MARCLVTGHKGYIGSKIFNRLEQSGHDVIGIDLLGTQYMGDIRSEKFLRFNGVWKEFKPEYIFHCAAKPSVQWSVDNPSTSLSHNVFGTSQVLEFAKIVGAKRVIFSSSAAVYGNNGAPCNPYGAHKLMSELECKIYSDLYDVDTVCLRYFNVFSKDQQYGGPYSTVISAWNYALRNRKTLFINGDGEQSRDFIHVDDIVDCNIFCMDKEFNFNGQHYDVGTGKATSLNQIKKTISILRDCEWLYNKEREGDIKASLANTKPLKDMGWLSKTNITECIQKIFGE
tara:strand:+ start:4671 stop:5525 length:855 start_codon:yes stop_codon:yes gene_type:complete